MRLEGVLHASLFKRTYPLLNVKQLAAARIAASNFTNAVNFSSARTTKRFPSPRCASATKIRAA